uniref:Uncharacterized protein n=1 Tax=Fagus sylvatica TaxID=28930 RepID=A0A2N9GZ82_FAGSY
MASPPLCLSLLHSQVSLPPSLSQTHGQDQSCSGVAFFTVTVTLNSLSLGVCLGRPHCHHLGKS